MDYTVITGGPGAGKTTLIEQLAAKGFACVAESGRAIIKDQSAIGGPGLPWESVELFAELMLSRDLRAHRESAALDSAVFFDRGIVDTIGYLRLEGRPVPGHFDTAARRLRYRRVFIAPFWPEIYTADAQRKQTPDVARATHDAISAAYREYGYRPVELPPATVEERVEFVMERISRASAATAPPSGRTG